MGSTRYDDAVYASTASTRKMSGVTFTHDASIRSGAAPKKAHESLDPSKPNAAGKLVRESFDSAAAPNSLAIGVLFDVTGSMREVPKIFIEKMPKLFAALVKKGYVADPHVLFGAIGDAYCDAVPLQIGQFEGGNETDLALGNIFLEGGGGGQETESYELAMYYMARHTDLDCVKKRGKKGYLFILGDETPYGHVNRNQVKRFIGDDLQEDITTEAILAELREKFEVFWIHPSEGSYTNAPSVVEPMKKMFGQHWLKLESAADVCELIIGTIGLGEGFDLDDVGGTLKDLGTSAAAVDNVTRSLATYAANTSAVAKVAKADGELVPTDTDSASRL